MLVNRVQELLESKGSEFKDSDIFRLLTELLLYVSRNRNPLGIPASLTRPDRTFIRSPRGSPPDAAK